MRTNPQPATFSMSVGHVLLRQCRKPSGWLGRLTLWRMNRSHFKMTEWGLTHVSVQPRDTILDLGCGGGRTVAKLATLANQGKVYGVDYSDESVAASRRTNRASIDAGRVEIVRAAVSQLPFPNQMFDLVTAVETHYYWPDLSTDLQEVLRVLKPSGALVVIAEAYKGGKYDALLQSVEALRQRGIMHYAHLTVDEHRELLSRAGYASVRVFEDYSRAWLCAVAGRAEG